MEIRELMEWAYEQFEQLEAFEELFEMVADLPPGPPAPSWITKAKAVPVPLKTQWVKASVEPPP